MISIYTAFKLYGKQNMVKFLRDRVTSRVNMDMTIDRIIYVLESYGLKKNAEKEINRYKGHVDFHKYGMVK